VRGDILSYVTSNNAAVRRLSAMLGEFALADLQDVAETIVNQSLEAPRAEIARLPQGSWSSTLVIDGYDAPVTLRATLTIDGSRVLVDYAGSDACLPRGINVVLNYARAYTVFALRCVISPEVPNNHGALLPYEVEAPEGSILNVQRPWPVAARHIVGQMLPDLVFGCLSQAIPDRVPVEGSSCLWSVQLRGRHPSSEQGAPGELFDTIFFNSGGSGARPGQDGLDGTAFPSGVRAMPGEVTEHGAPIVIWRKELPADSGGAGTPRGGPGFEVLAMFERVAHAARGRDGGADGSLGQVRLSDGTVLRGKGRQEIPAGRRLVLDVPGGGGWGDPHGRAADALAQDLADGFVSEGSAGRIYGRA